MHKETLTRIIRLEDSWAYSLCSHFLRYMKSLNCRRVSKCLQGKVLVMLAFYTSPLDKAENTWVVYIVVHTLAISVLFYLGVTSFDNHDRSTRAGRIRKGDIKYGQSERHTLLLLFQMENLIWELLEGTILNLQQKKLKMMNTIYHCFSEWHLEMLNILI